VIALAAISAACGPAPPPTTAATSIPTVFVLPPAPFPNACRGIGIDAVLVGGATDPRIAWLATARQGNKELVWPPGYVARFGPDLEIIDGTGRVVFRQGDKVTGGCVKGPPDALGSVLLIRPEDLATE
jgi:hypothetical protein